MAKQENDFRKVRRILGLTAQDVADELGVSRSLISMVEIGIRHLPSDPLIEVAKLVAELERVEREHADSARVELPLAQVRRLSELTWLDEKRKADLKIVFLNYAQALRDEAAFLERRLDRDAQALRNRYDEAERCDKLKARFENPSDKLRGLFKRSDFRRDKESKFFSATGFLSLFRTLWKIESLRQEAARAQAFVEE